MSLTPKQFGEAMARNQSQALEGERPQLATVTRATDRGAATGQLKCALTNGDVIWVEASGDTHELAVGDFIYVERLGSGVSATWRMVDFFKTAGGSHTPTIRQDIVSKIHELYADDGDPQAVDVDSSGNVTVNPAGGDQDFIVEGNTEDHLLVVDAGADVVRLGDWDTNYAQFAIDGELTLVGTAKVQTIVELPIATGGGTADIAAWNGAPSINLDADGETFYGSFVAPQAWTGTDNLTLYLAVGNEIAETDNDDVSITCQVRGYADGETTGDAGQTVACTLNLTGGDQAIHVVNLVSGTIVYNDGTYPIAQGDVVVIRATVNLAGAGECTGPLHVTRWWVEYTKDKLGEAT